MHRKLADLTGTYLKRIHLPGRKPRKGDPDHAEGAAVHLVPLGGWLVHLLGGSQQPNRPSLGIRHLPVQAVVEGMIIGILEDRNAIITSDCKEPW